jgi:glyoxylase-like metal-dependent hydrolase (beta-lactamase superfamily II)
MIRIERHGDVTRFEMMGTVSRLIGYSASAYLVRGALIDCGFHDVRRDVTALLASERPRGVLITHHHEDHAGNVELLARAGVPIAAGADTLEKLRAPAPIRLYRRVTWGSAPPLRTAFAEFTGDELALIPAPGHSSDHHVVWDAREGTLFGGDLYLGVKVRVAHPGESPRMLSRTLRRIAALAPARLFDAHRGLVRNPSPLLLAKADWIDETITAIERRLAEGASDARVVRDVLGGESIPGYFSGGDYSRSNFVRAVRRTSGY